MKRFLRTAALALLALVLVVAGWAGAIALGWLPIPGFVTDYVAQSRGLSPAEAKTLERTVNLYSVLKTAPEAPLIDKALGLLQAGESSDAAWSTFAKQAWPQLSAGTLERVRQQLDIAPEDFAAVKSLLDAVVARTADGKTFALTSGEADALTGFDAKYHLVETLEKLR